MSRRAKRERLTRQIGGHKQTSAEWELLNGSGTSTPLGLISAAIKSGARRKGNPHAKRSRGFTAAWLLFCIISGIFLGIALSLTAFGHLFAGWMLVFPALLCHQAALESLRK